MASDALRRASASLRLALDAQTLDYQAKHASDARRTYEEALRDIAIRREAAAALPNEDARLIAAHAAAVDELALNAFAGELELVEREIAARLRQPGRPPLKRLFAIE